MLASDAIAAATDLLNDAGMTTWTQASLLRWIGEAQRQIVQLLPRAYQVREALTLTANESVQTLPDDCVRLVRILRNLGVGGDAPGRRVSIIDEEGLGRIDPNWHASTAAASISHFAVDDETPRIYMVWPRPNAALKLDAVVSKVPAAPTATGNTLALGDEYQTAIVNFMLYRAYLKNHTRGDVTKANGYYSAFERSLGMKDAADMKQSPERKLRDDPAQ